MVSSWFWSLYFSGNSLGLGFGPVFGLDLKLFMVMGLPWSVYWSKMSESGFKSKPSANQLFVRRAAAVPLNQWLQKSV